MRRRRKEKEKEKEKKKKRKRGEDVRRIAVAWLQRGDCAAMVQEPTTITMAMTTTNLPRWSERGFGRTKMKR